MSYKEHQISWTDEKISRLWDYYSRTPPYSDMYFAKVHGREILQRLKVYDSDIKSLLDFGCGRGYIWNHLLEIGARWNYTGLDFSNESVTALAATAGAHPQFGGSVHVSQLPSPLQSNSFDAALLLEVVEHLNDEHLDGSLAELSRVVKPGGFLLVTTPNNEDLRKLTSFCPDCGCVFHKWQHVRSWTPPDLSAVMRRWRFELVHMEAAILGSRLHRFTATVRRFLRRSGDEERHIIAIYRKR